MDLVVFENNKPYVIDEFREGRFDYIELASDVAETKFFQFLFDKQLVERLAEHYPSPRKRHHVPMWMYLSSQLSLRLHGLHSFHSYPWIIRSGGLIDVLGPEVARREVDDDGNLTIECQGFNDRNFYPRRTPCDQDYLRKLARDTSPEELERWYNEHAAVLLGELGAYDSEGLFIGDGTYLFVPDNPRYEGSQRLLFDEHNHPVSKEQEKQMTPAQRDRCRWRRYYKAVLLLHCDQAGERFLVVGIRVLREGESEATALWPLVDTFIQKLPGVMKVLLLDRGFINGPQIGRLKTKYAIDTVIPIRSDMDILADVRGLTQLETIQWESYEPTHRPSLPPQKSAAGASPVMHPVVQKRERKRQKTLAARRSEAAAAEEPATDPSRVREQTWIARFPELTSWSDCPVPLTGVLSRDVFADGHQTSWLLVTTSSRWSARRVRDLYGLRTDIEERHRQVKCFWDLTRFHSTAWSLIVSQTVFVCLTYSLLQLHLLQQGHQELNRRTWPTSRRLLPDGDRVLIYRQQYFGFFTLLEHTELMLSLEGKARRRALAKARRLRQESSLQPASAGPS
ncbi:MAG: transposase [Planctomycetes bacterium]|nr:transposase [Planctomycetota bacterium]